VALQGTLDTFALADVLRLLAATQKTGRLRIGGGRGSGSIWMTTGAVTGLEVSHAPYATAPVDALFELLRFTEGSFTFEADVVHDAASSPADIEELLTGAEALLAEWREIESVVPSMDAWVTLRRSLATDAVTIDRERWTTLVAVGGGASVRSIATALDYGELPVSRAVRDLVELGVADIEAAAPASATVEPSDEASSEPSAARPPLFGTDDGPEASTSTDAAETPHTGLATPPLGEPADEHEPLPTARPIRARRPRTTLVASDEPAEPERFVPLELPGHGPAAYDREAEAEVAAEDDADEADVSESDLAAAFPGLTNRPTSEAGETVEADDEDLARQLATLSPRAAEAVRAAAGAETAEERDAALDAAAQDDDQPINRGLLLKFLSSVKS
jgi:Domain of unknown function (DUF4388)